MQNQPIKYKSNVTRVPYKDGYAVVKIYTKKNHIWKLCENFDNIKDDVLLNRISNFYDKMEELHFGPKIYKKYIDNNRLVILMEYFPTQLTIEYIKLHYIDINNFISNLYNSGYIHGDLPGNLMLNSNNEIKIIDFETMFELNEKDNPLVCNWAIECAGSIDEYIKIEADCRNWFTAKRV